MRDNLVILGVTYENVTGLKAKNTQGETVVFSDDNREEPLKDVVFIDYDGSILHNYTASEFLALNAMPANPSRAGLTAQGWNWNLSDAQTYVTNYGMLVIGQNYTTNDGKTRIYLSVTEADTGQELSVGITPSVSGGVTIDWDDGNMTTTSGTSFSWSRHQYNTAGDYVVTLNCTSGTFILGGSSITDRFLYTADGVHSQLYECVNAIEFGNNVTTAKRDALIELHNLKTVSLPTTLVSFDSAPFASAWNLKAIVLPPGFVWSSNYLCNNAEKVKFISVAKDFVPTAAFSDGNLRSLRMCALPELSSFSERMFYGAFRLEKVVVPGTYASVPTNTIRMTKRLKKFTIPASVTSVPQYALAPALGITEYHFLSTTPPTLAAAGVNSLSTGTGVSIYVPYSADHSVLEAYQNATNWSTYAAYMQEEPQS